MSTEGATVDSNSGLGALAKALAKAQGSMRSASKDAVNPHFKSKYADLASVWEACRDALAANNLAVVQRVQSDPRGVTVSTMLLHESGAQLSDSCWVPVSKPDAQGYGSAITYARRYSLAAMVGVAPEDDDGNAAVGGNGAPQPQGVAGLRAKAAAPAAQPQPATKTPPQRRLTIPEEPPPHGDADAPGDAHEAPQATHDRSISFAFGHSKGFPLSAMDVSSLDFYESAFKRDLADASKAKWHAKTTQQLAAVQAEKRFRGL